MKLNTILVEIVLGVDFLKNWIRKVDTMLSPELKWFRKIKEKCN